jgi:DNA primase
LPIPESFIDRLIERSDIVDVVSSYVQLSKKGGSHMGLCPFHNEKTASFSVSAERQVYHCFGCGAGGGVINFIMSIENLSYPDAIHFLANRAGMTVPEEGRDEELPKLRRRMLELNREAARWFHQNLNSDSGKKAADYLEKRKISQRTAVRFGLGAAPEGWDGLIRAMKDRGFEKDELVRAGLAVNREGRVYDKFRDRLMFPVIDMRGDVIAFGGRAIGEAEPKYLNSPETLVYSKRRSLYGINLAKNSKRGNIILCEGNVDVVTLHQAGFDNAVASMGTALTTEQTRLISRFSKEIIICYDNDPAGLKATERALEILKNSEFTVKVLKLPNRIVDGKALKCDADDFIKLYGAEAFEKLLKGSDSGMEYRLLSLQAEFDLSRDEDRVEFLKRAGDTIAQLSSPVEREVYAARAAEAAGISAQAMSDEVRRAADRKRREDRKKWEQETKRPERSAQPKVRSLKYENIRSALAEEGVIRLLLLDPSLINVCTLTQEEFTSAFLGRLYADIRSRYAENRSLLPPAIAAALNEEEASLLTEILDKPEAINDGKRALNDYTGVIRTERLINSSDLAEIARKMKEKKGGIG